MKTKDETLDLDLIRDILLYKLNYASSNLVDVEICATDKSDPDIIVVYYNTLCVDDRLSIDSCADDCIVYYKEYIKLLRQKKLKEIGI